MAKLMIEGLHKLDGEIVIHGAKNGALPILAATLLAVRDTAVVHAGGIHPHTVFFLFHTAAQTAQ